MLAEIGFAGAVLAREMPDGLMLVDGHLRAETAAPDQEIPVFVLDVTETKADKLLAMAAEHIVELRRRVFTERMTAKTTEVVVDCRAKFWGGAVDHAYRAWPYAAKVVPCSDLPVVFVQSTEFKGNPALSQKDKKLATVKPDEWQAVVKTGK